MDPLLSSSTYLIISFHNLSSIFYYKLSTYLISFGLMLPLPSSSNKSKAAFSFSSDSKLRLSMVTKIHSKYSISPEPSLSTLFIVWSRSSSASFPQNALKPTSNSSRVKTPSLSVSRILNACSNS